MNNSQNIKSFLLPVTILALSTISCTAMQVQTPNGANIFTPIPEDKLRALRPMPFEELLPTYLNEAKALSNQLRRVRKKKTYWPTIRNNIAPWSETYVFDIEQRLQNSIDALEKDIEKNQDETKMQTMLQLTYKFPNIQKEKINNMLSTAKCVKHYQDVVGEHEQLTVMFQRWRKLREYLRARGVLPANDNFIEKVMIDARVNVDILIKKRRDNLNQGDYRTYEWLNKLTQLNEGCDFMQVYEMIKNKIAYIQSKPHRKLSTKQKSDQAKKNHNSPNKYIIVSKPDGREVLINVSKWEEAGLMGRGVWGGTDGIPTEDKKSRKKEWNGNPNENIFPVFMAKRAEKEWLEAIQST